MAGSISLSGQAALRSGAGLVTIATPAPCVPIVAGFEPCYMTLALPIDESGELQSEALARVRQHPCDVWGCGPGLGRNASVTRFVADLYRQVTQPMVVDADGLNALAEDPSILRSWGGPRVLTPHVGEFRRLVARTDDSVAELRAAAPAWADRQGVVLVLKGHQTLVTDGRLCYTNSTGNPGMATGGSGDILSGVIAALMGQGLTPFDAAQLGVYVHGLAGDLAAQRLGQIGLIARDLLAELPAAWAALAN